MTSKDINECAASRNDEDGRLEKIAKDIEKLQGTATLKIAVRLAEARDLFRYRRDEGGFAGWVENRLRFSRQTAYNLLQVYARFGGESVKYLDTFPASVLYLLSAPSTPETVSDEILERAKGGEKLGVKEVKAEIAAAKPSRARRKSKASSTKSSEPVKTTPTAEPTPINPPVETENAGLKHEIRLRPMNLHTAIQYLIEQANRTTCFENVLPENVVYAAKDLGRVISHLNKLNKFMVKRRKAVKAKKSSAVAAPVADDEALCRPSAMPAPELTPDEIKAVIAAINRENNDTSWRLDADGRGGVLMVGLDADGNVDGKPEKANLIELARDFAIDIDQIRERVGASIRVVTQSVH